jgi:hypothetical protein
VGQHSLRSLSGARRPVKLDAAPGLLATRPGREFAYRSDLSGWTPTRVLRARDSADMGNLTEAADCVEVLLTDDRVDGVLATRTHGLFGLPLHFEEGSPEAREILAGTGKVPGEWWRMHDEAELTRLQNWGLVLGVGLAQRIALSRKPGELQKYRLETWSPRWLRWVEDEQKWYVQTTAGEECIEQGGRWIVYTPYGSHRPWAAGKWNALVFPWLLKRFSLEDRANHSQTLGGSFLVAHAPVRSSQKQREKMQTDLALITKDSRFVLPEGWDLKFVEATGRTWEIYDGQIGWSDQAITIVLAGQIVTTEGSPGFNSGNIHDQIKGDFVRFDGERMSSCLAEQSLRPWAVVNFGSIEATPWPKWNTERPVDQEQQARTFEQLGRSVADLDKSLKAENCKVDIVALASRFNIPIKDAPPDEATGSVAIPLAPTDIAKVVKVDEARGSVGLGPTGDETGGKFISELEAQDLTQIISSLGLPPDSSIDQVVEAINNLKNPAAPAPAPGGTP